MRRLLASVALALAIVSIAPAQNTLTTTFASNNGQSGNMFDIRAAPLGPGAVIDSFDVNLDANTAAVPMWNLNVYFVTAGGSYGPVMGAAGSWTLIGNVSVVSNGLNVPTPLPLPIGVAIAPGATQGFYVSVTNGTSINYTGGTVEGAIFAQDTCIQFLEGRGTSNPEFGGTFVPRVWNGNIHYTPLGVCPAPPWQTNSASLSFDFNGVQGTQFSGAVTPSCVGSIATVNLGGSLAGAPWDAAITAGTTTVPVGGGGIVLAGSNESVNINVAHPSFALIFGLAFTNALPVAALPLATPAAELDAQVVALDGASPNGLRLSQAGCLQAVTSGGPVAGPATDDSNVTVNLGGAPNCWLPGGFNFCNTNYTQIHVSSNARVLFGGPDTDFSATVAEGLTDNPFFGAWCDLNPALGGSITISSPAAGVVQVDYVGVPYFVQAAQTNTFSLQLDASGANHVVRILGIQGIFQPVANAQFLGMTCGNLGATDGGASAFIVGSGIGPVTPATDMLYEFTAATGTSAAFAAGVNDITFTPTGGLGYMWTAN